MEMPVTSEIQCVKDLRTNRAWFKKRVKLASKSYETLKTTNHYYFFFIGTTNHYYA